jgi:SWI/SNF-related matrix-associated actin-dependent regulator 1 of chromatin subfamily A
MSKIVEQYNEKEFKLMFGGPHFRDALTFVKTLEGRVYHGEGRFWTVKISPQIIQKLKQNRWAFKDAAYDLVYGPMEKDTEPMDLTIKVIPKETVDKTVLNTKLRPYQIEALEQICGLHGRAILSFPPGCGKTAVAASYFRVKLEDFPTLIICPAFLKIHWKRELRYWGGLSSYICEGRKPHKSPHKTPAWVINYDLLQYWQPELIFQQFKTIIIDECQMIANEQAARTDSLLQIARQTPHIIAVSGTPIKNRPKEFFTILNLLYPKLFPNRYRFYHHFCDPQYGWAGLEFKGATNVEELHAKISGFMIRKEKAELLPELPPKARYVIPMELSEPEVYEKAEKEIEELIGKNKKKEAHEALMELSNTAFPLKKDNVMAMLHKWLDDNPEESVVIVAFHHAVIDYLKEEFEDSIVVDGRHPASKRQGLVDRFQAGESRILIGQIQAAGIGFTMTKASTMFIVEICYVPGDLEQVEERLHRIAQVADEVSIYYLIGENTIEDSMLDSVQRKANNLARILDGKGLKFFEEEKK